MSKHTLKDKLTVGSQEFIIHNISLIKDIDQKNLDKPDIESLPFSARVIIENLARSTDLNNNSDDNLNDKGWEDILNAVKFYEKGADDSLFIAFYPSRVLMQDFTGVPAVVDFAAMRDAVAAKGTDPKKINPLVPVDLIIDHSIQLDHFREKDAFALNAKKEYERNQERYKLLKWAQKNFDNFRVVPPESGICHQVNLEHLAPVVATKKTDNGIFAFPDTLVGTDSHTTMINGLGVLGWGVGGIEAEAVMLGQPYYMNLPEIIGVNLRGKPGKHITSTDIALYITQMLRQENVVEKIVEYTGEGLKQLSLTDRATIANMAPEYGATSGFFPVDEETISYLKKTNRSAALVEAYCRKCSLFNNYDHKIVFSKTLDIDLSCIEPSVAGPSRPQDRIPLSELKQKTGKIFDLSSKKAIEIKPENKALTNGSIIIAAITSCTNTSNPYTMIGAGLTAKKAVEKGLTIPWYVKTSLSPGSRVVVDYLKAAGLMEYLETLGFNNTGFGCMTCIGNSGPLDPVVEKAVKDHNLDVMSVLSGNRNFEARIHQAVKGNFLMSPALVVIYAIAGKIDIDPVTEPLGFNKQGEPIFMSDIWPDDEEIKSCVENYVQDHFFKDQYEHISEGGKLWQELKVTESATFTFEESSTYIRSPPFFSDFTLDTPDMADVQNARALLVLEDSVTTDHISPAGAIPTSYPAGAYLKDKGIPASDFNSYGSRRGNHEVMMRGTFANIRINNSLVSETGGWTLKFPENDKDYIFNIAGRYQEEGVPLIVFAGKEYGTGSSRDWAAKGTQLLGIKAVIAESFERIHRSNLVGMGVLPLIFKDNENLKSLGLTGKETFDIIGADQLKPNGQLTVKAHHNDKTISFNVIVKLNTDIEIDYIKNRGILPFVLRQMIRSDASASTS